MIDAAESIAAKWVRSLINPNSMQQALRDELLRTVPMLRRLPRHVDRAFSNLERDGLRVRVTHFSDEHDERVVARLVNRLVLAFLSGAIGLVSVGLIAIDGGPAFSDRTTLFRGPRVLRPLLRDGAGDAGHRRGAARRPQLGPLRLLRVTPRRLRHVTRSS